MRAEACDWHDCAMRLVVADDAVVIRAGLVSLLSSAGFDVLAEVGTAMELLAAVDRDPPDVAITDIRMPPTHTREGLDAAQTIRDRHPGIGLLVFSQYLEPEPFLQLADGASAGVGYLLKERVSDVEAFVDAIRRVGAGESVVDPDIVSLLLGRRRKVDPLDRLSTREREILALMAEGRSNAGIAAQLVLSPKTVEHHISSILSKLDIFPEDGDHRRVLAVVRYLQQ
jgi:DNA-binding NarL/FixJ family response regulator